MYKYLLPLIAFLAIQLPATAGETGDFDAKSFVNGKCLGCHGPEMFTRSQRRVNSLKELETQIRMCDANLGTTLFDDDIKAVVNYLNDEYYKFGN